VIEQIIHVQPAVLTGLLIAALSAGWIDAVVGGGGLIQLPAMLIGIGDRAPATILGTNKLSSIIGTSAAATTYLRRKESRPEPVTVLVMSGLAFGGSFGGAKLATMVPQSVFRPLVLVLLVLVGIWTWRRPALGERDAYRFTARIRLTIAALSGAVIGFYDGIFGPGTGSFLIFILVGLLGYSFLRASATAKVVNWSTNLAALAVFVPDKHVMVGLGLCMGACNLIGGITGARMAAARGSAFVRIAFLCVVALLIAKLGYDQLSSL
jgi:uncharacterized protein